MKRLLLVLLFVACREPAAEDLHRPISRGIDNTEPAFETTPRPPVVFTPPAEAREVAPGVFVAVVHEAKRSAPAIETDREFLFTETVYDAQGERSRPACRRRRGRCFRPAHELRWPG